MLVLCLHPVKRFLTNQCGVFLGLFSKYYCSAVDQIWNESLSYLTTDVKSAARCRLLNPWRQNDVKSTDWTVDRENLGTRLCCFWWAENQRAKLRNSFKNGEIFLMNNKAIIVFAFRRIWRILQFSEGAIPLGLRPLWITPSLICRILHILFSLIQ